MKKWMKYSISFASIALIFTLGFSAYMMFSNPVILKEESSLVMYDINDEVFYESRYLQNSNWTTSENIPSLIKDCTVSVEDKRFYDHFGIDPIRLTKALITNIKQQSIVQGGSTITQQMIKNLFLTQSQTMQRKVTEMYMSFNAEMNYSKDFILETYLNTIYYGHGVYGVTNAATYFFDKELDELNIAEVAMLVGIPNSPNNYSPFINFDKSKKRQKIVLNVLLNNEEISASEYEQALNTPLVLTTKEVRDEKQISGYFKDEVIRQCKEKNLCNAQQDILIHTTYNPLYQQYLQDSINKYTKDSDQQVAGILIEPFTFNVMAISGGKEYGESQYNRALSSSRQVGSTIKPLLYYLALDQGFTPSTTLTSTPTSFRIDEQVIYTPENYLELYTDAPISLTHAISTSDNIYAVKTHLMLGTESLLGALEAFDIKQDMATPSMALGTTDFPLIDLAKIYNTFASVGLYDEVSFIEKIVDVNNDELYVREQDLKQLLKVDETLVLTSLLRAPFDIKNLNVSAPSLLSYEPFTTVAAKSGSSDWDSLIAGYNPQLTMVVWNGYDENQPLTTGDERKISKQIFRNVFNTIYPKNHTGPWYEKNDNIMEVKIDPISGEIDNNGSKYWFIKE